MAFTTPTASDFKAYFVRDFPYGTAANTVMDTDITKSINEALFNFNSGLFDTQAKYSMCLMYLSAHYLVMDLRASSQGIQGNYPWMTTNKSVGSVSEGITIPQRILDNPYLAMISKTTYGAKYLELILPNLVGNMFAMFGDTKP